MKTNGGGYWKKKRIYEDCIRETRHFIGEYGAN